MENTGSIAIIELATIGQIVFDSGHVANNIQQAHQCYKLHLNARVSKTCADQFTNE